MKLKINGNYVRDANLNPRDITRAVKTSDSIILDDALVFGGITDFSCFTLEDGEWTTPKPTPQEQLDAQADAIAELAAIIAGGE